MLVSGPLSPLPCPLSVWVSCRISVNAFGRVRICALRVLVGRIDWLPLQSGEAFSRSEAAAAATASNRVKRARENWSTRWDTNNQRDCTYWRDDIGLKQRLLRKCTIETCYQQVAWRISYSIIDLCVPCCWGQKSGHNCHFQKRVAGVQVGNPFFLHGCLNIAS